MTLLSDEMIEKAARAMLDRAPGVANSLLDKRRLDARAALESILPDVVEECAQAVKQFPGSRALNAPVPKSQEYIRHNTMALVRRELTEAAEAVRSLLAKGE